MIFYRIWNLHTSGAVVIGCGSSLARALGDADVATRTPAELISKSALRLMELRWSNLLNKIVALHATVAGTLARVHYWLHTILVGLAHFA